MIQIRNVPDEVHARLREKAALAGMTLSDFLKREVTRIAESLSWEEVVEQMRPHQVRLDPDEVVGWIKEDRPGT